MKAKDCARRVVLRVVSGDKTLAATGVEAAPDIWRQGSLTFTVPNGEKTASFYFSVGKGEADRVLYVDNIVLSRK